jgi:hypothetical protein
VEIKSFKGIQRRFELQKVKVGAVAWRAPYNWCRTDLEQNQKVEIMNGKDFLK